ncbi:MAG TPA: hypothetical protein PLK28_11145, partial [Candidatus Rifleibacterium sp.]|nr:hypothetical protein [Candidatus Rifleibacterium sp.]
MSIEQLVNLPAMPVSEKIACIWKVLDDSDEGVRAAARAALAKLSGDGEARPATPVPPAPAFIPVTEPALPLPDEPSASASASSVLPPKPSVVQPAQPQTMPPAARPFPATVSGNAPPPSLSRPTQPLPVASSPAVTSGVVSQTLVQPPAALVGAPAVPPELDDPVDPSLP